METNKLLYLFLVKHSKHHLPLNARTRHHNHHTLEKKKYNHIPNTQLNKEILCRHYKILVWFLYVM